LRVTGVREHPRHEVTDGNGPQRRNPRPGVIVGLTQIVVQLEAKTPDLDVEPFPELPIDRGDVIGKENRQLAHRAGTVAAERSGTELPPVDRDVETALRPVAGEARLDVLVGEDGRSLMATL